MAVKTHDLHGFSVKFCEFPATFAADPQELGRLLLRHPRVSLLLGCLEPSAVGDDGDDEQRCRALELDGAGLWCVVGQSKASDFWGEISIIAPLHYEYMMNAIENIEMPIERHQERFCGG